MTKWITITGIVFFLLGITFNMLIVSTIEPEVQQQKCFCPTKTKIVTQKVYENVSLTDCRMMFDEYMIEHRQLENQLRYWNNEIMD